VNAVIHQGGGSAIIGRRTVRAYPEPRL